MKTRYLLTCAAAAFAATASHGQTDGAAPPAGTELAAADPSGNTGIGEIVVTAQRRSESIQKVPLTIQAFTGEQLSRLNVKNFDDFIKYVPNVSFSNNGPGQGSIFMRGLSSGFAGGQSSATIASFPNVALYLDDQSMQFPFRNADIYFADMERVEVLEGPQGTLFGGGAEAGAIRYITNKPKLDRFEGHAEGMLGGTSGGAMNNSETITLNVPVIRDRFAVRATFYNERRGGYIDNVQSTFTRSNQDLGNYYFGIAPNGAGTCPNGQPAGSAGCTIPNQQINNSASAKKNFNPVTYTGGRIEALAKINDDWDVLITESVQDMHAEGTAYDYPIGSDFQTLKPLQVTTFVPNFDHDRFENTSWTLHGKLGPLRAIYTGGYMVRHIDNQADYTNYSRTGGGILYQCTGGNNGLFGSSATAPLQCYSPATYWRDKVKNTHLSNEFRLSTPDDWRLRAIAGVYQETFRIQDVMNFNYKTIPSCNPANLATARAGGPICLANVRPTPGSDVNDPSIRGDNTGFGEDVKRGYDQYAFFGSVDFDIIPNVLTIIGGTRYFHYHEFETGSQYGTGGGCINVPNGECVGGTVDIGSHNDKVNYHGFKSRASLTWHVNRDTMAYFTFSQGFRPGGFSRTVRNVANDGDGNPQFSTPNGYAPDSLNNYEIGLKTSLFDRHLQINLSAYDMDWSNVQFQFYNPTELGNTSFSVNGPDYNIKGAELQLNALLMPGLTVSGSATYNRSKQTSSPCLISNIAASPTFGQCITEVRPSGSPVALPFQNPYGALGTSAPFSPKVQASGRIRYDWTINELKAFVQVGANYTGKMFTQPATYLSGEGIILPTTTFLRYKLPDYATVDVSLGVARDRWFVQGFVTNLNNSHASVFTSSTQFIQSQVPIRPRVFGMRLGYDF